MGRCLVGDVNGYYYMVWALCGSCELDQHCLV